MEEGDFVTLAAAMMACWPADVDKVRAIRAIKAGEVARISGGESGSANSSGGGGESGGGSCEEVQLPSSPRGARTGGRCSSAKVERHPGKRNVAATDRLVWKGEVRALPEPLWVAMHKPAGYITTGAAGAEKDNGKSVHELLTHPNKHLRAIGE